MFTGIVEEVGIVKKLKRKRGSVVLSIGSKRVAPKVKTDDSVAIDGVCLTVIGSDKSSFTVQAVEETLKKTTLGRLREGSGVNLERALVMNGAFGGHFVLGHVDGITTVRKIETKESSWVFWFTIDKRFAQYLVPVGSIAINGVSLTIALLKKSAFAISIIPHTMEATTFRSLRKGGIVNVEYDVLGKYVERLLDARLK